MHEIERLTQELIEIPSITGNKEQARRALDLIDRYLGNKGVIVSKRFEKNGIVSRLWGDRSTLMSPKLLLSGHIDVVDAPKSFFVPKKDSGKIIGRGSGDMKGHIASMVLAYKRWLEENTSSKGVGLILSSDEEVGGFNGTKYVIERTNLRPDVVFIPDAEISFDIVDSQKAPHHFHVRAMSTTGGGHVSRAFKLDNPVNKILSVYMEMRRKYALASTKSKKDEWKSTFEMTVFRTGNGKGRDSTINSANQIPEWAEAWFGWRWPLEVEISGQKATYNSGLKDLQRAAKKYRVDILKDDHGFGEGCYTNPNAGFVQKWKGVIEPIIRRKIGFQHMHGATDGRHFYKYGSQVLVTSAVAGGAHSDHEWVDIDSLVKLSEAIYQYQKLMVK